MFNKLPDQRSPSTYEFISNKQTGLITFSGTNFKTIATDETDFSYKEALNRFVDGSLKFGPENEEYITIQDGTAKGELIGGNLSLIRGMVVGKYSIDFTDKILFLEELGFETDPAATIERSSCLLHFDY